MSDKELLAQAEHDASILRIFGDMEAYQRSLPERQWNPTGNTNSRGEKLWASEPR